MNKLLLVIFLILLFVRSVNSQTFPNPATLSTGQGAQGTNDPIWTVSPWVFGTPPGPLTLTYVPAYISNNCAPGAWVDPAALPSPVNNGNWITGADAPCTGQTGYRYFRLTLNLPPDCGSTSVTTAGSYILYLQGYVDNTLSGVYINGNDEGIPAGGSFNAGSQVIMALDGPWVPGVNYVDFLVYNGGGPYGLLLVADQTANSSLDSDHDGISNINDQCPCDSGNNSLGCIDPPHANQCNTPLIRQTFVNAGCTELANCNDACSMYFYNPQSLTGDNAQSFAQNLGANLVSVQSSTENTCIANSLVSHGFGGTIWIGFNDAQSEGTFVWYDQSPVIYTNWAAGEPNNAGDEDCVQIYPNGGWNDLDCSSAGSSSVIEVNLCPVLTIAPAITSICVGQSTSFSASTLLGANPYTYVWTSSPAGFNSTSATPTVSPLVTTTYFVTSTDRYGCRAQNSITVTVNSVTATASSNSPCVGQTLNLTSGPNGMISYSWLGVNSFSSALQNPSINNVSLANAGIYGVLVTDANGCQDTATILVTIKPLPVPTASSNTPVCKGQTLNLTSGGGVSYSWWGPNGFSNATQSPSVLNVPVANSGVYHVTVTGANSCVDSTTTTVVINPLPVVAVSSNTPVCVGQTLNLTSGGGTSYTWWGPNGYVNATQSPSINSVSSAASGTYHVTVTDVNTCVDSATTVVVINSLPIPTASSNTPVCFGLTLNLTSGGGTSYAWWGPNGFSSGNQNDAVTNVTIPASGTYHVSVTDLNGCIDSTTTSVLINPLPIPTASNNGPRCADSTITFTGGGGTTYAWWGPNGFSSATQSPSITNTQSTHSGIYHLTVTDLNTCIDSTSTTLTIYQNPVANAGNDGSMCAGGSVVLNGSGAGTGGAYAWTPSGAGSASASYSVSPTQNTYYQLYVTDLHGCKDRDTAKVSVNPKPLVNYTATSVCQGFATTFNNTSSDTSGGAFASFWSFNDAAAGTSNLASPTYTYASCGTYSVALVVTSDSGCIDLKTNNVIVNCVPNAAFTTTNICYPAATTFNNSSVVSGTAALNSKWDFVYLPNVIDSMSGVTNPSYNYLSDGTYNVALISYTAFCSDTAYSQVTVYPKPNADFSVNSVCLNGTTLFTDLSNVNAPDNITNWAWDYDFTAPFTPDYSVGVGTGASNIYPTINPVNAELIVTTNNGCKDTIFKPVTIYPLPVAAFTVASVCLNTPSQFINNSTVSSGTININNWIFNTTIGVPTSTALSPSNTYPTSNNYAVQLHVTTNNGCVDSLIVNTDVYPNPSVDFTTDVYRGCEPLCINLAELATISSIPPGSANASYAWSFGDSLLGTAPNEGHCYENDGLYDVKLKVTSNKGCITTETKPGYISVYPNPTAEFTADPMVTTVLNPNITFMDASSGGSYLNWDFGDSTNIALSNIKDNLLHTYSDTGTYIVTQVVTTEYNCVDSIQHTIIINPEFIFYAPNAFSPNRDGLNDLFYGTGIGIKEYELTIYNRWGSKIATVNKLTGGWDGTKGNGDVCPSEVYIWEVKIIDVLGLSHAYNGTVTLIR